MLKVGLSILTTASFRRHNAEIQILEIVVVIIGV